MVTTPPLSPIALSNFFNNLADVIEEISGGPWQFIQLRGNPLSSEDIDRGDVDLLGSRDSVDRLLAAAKSWVQNGQCHLVVRARDANKTSVILLSLDGRHVLKLDLWIKLWQIEDRNTHLQYEDCQHLLSASDASIKRLPPQIEASVYLHHLRTKQKSISSPHVQQRLTDYSKACLQAGASDLSGALLRCAQNKIVDPTILNIANVHLNEARLLKSTKPRSRWRDKIPSEITAAFLAPPRKIAHIAVMGCDGSGKTSLAAAQAATNPGKYSTFTGKRLYRNSLIYKFMVIAVRPLLFQGRERFDDTLAPWNYLRALISLEARVWFFPRGVTLIDRSLLDFLVVDRKSDNPRFHRASRHLFRFGRRIPTIHLLVPGDRLSSRKAEMTPTGHRIYDELIFNHATQRFPTDYTLFFNGNDLDFSRSALDRVLSIVSKD